MHAHGPRTVLRRENVIALALFFSVAFVAVCGFTTGMWQSSAEASVGGGRGDQLPPEFANRNLEDIKKDFNDDDLKVKEQKPRGKWGYGLGFDKEQLDDALAPVAVGAIQSLSGGGKYAGVIKIKRVKIKNRSSKAVNSVQFRWTIASLDDPTKVLLEGATPFANFWAEANSSQVVEIPTLYPTLLFKPLAKDGELNGWFDVTIGVQEARFADGSFWRRQEIAAYLKFLDPYSRFPSLASLVPGIISPRAGTSNKQTPHRRVR